MGLELKLSMIYLISTLDVPYHKNMVWI